MPLVENHNAFLHRSPSNGSSSLASLLSRFPYAGRPRSSSFDGNRSRHTSVERLLRFTRCVFPGRYGGHEGKIGFVFHSLLEIYVFFIFIFFSSLCF